MNQSTVRDARKPGFIQIAILLITVGVSVLVTAVLGPSVFKMEAYFADVENVQLLVPLSLTLPMLVMSVFSVIAGAISDRVGRKWLLVGAAVFYGVVGMMPLVLTDLYAILGTRIVLGIFEAFVMVTGIALIGDFFVGSKRARLLALQTTAASLMAFVFNNVGGILGDISWRVPYYTYAFGFLLALMAAFFLWEPNRRAQVDVVTDELNEPTLQPLMIALTCVLAVIVGFVFLVTPVHFGYLFQNIGVEQGSLIGPAYGVNSLGVIAGTLLFGWGLNGRASVGFQIAAGCIVMAIGFYGMSIAQTYQMMTLSGLINGIGGGLLLPAAVTWNMRLLPTRIRGFGTGAWQSGFFLGNFLAAWVVVLIGNWLGGGRPEAVHTFALGLLVLAAIGVMGAVLQNRTSEKVVQA